MRWVAVTAGDPAALELHRRHYSYRLDGSRAPRPPRARVVGPGRRVVLLTPDNLAVWATSAPDMVAHRWPETWACGLFRNEGPHLSSELILEALAATRYVLGDPPAGGVITFVNVDAVRRKRDPGRCFRRAGFVERGWTKRRGLLVLGLDADLIPPAEAPLERQPALFAA